MGSECDHVVAVWGGEVTLSECDKRRKSFEDAVAQFDTESKALPHPGYWIYMNYCPDCGHHHGYRDSKSGQGS